jgi:hypothetical protein
VQTNTSKYLHPLAYGISVKSTKVFKRSSSNTLHLGWHSWPLLGIVFGTQTVPLTYARGLGDIQCWVKVISRAVCPE